MDPPRHWPSPPPPPPPPPTKAPGPGIMFGECSPSLIGRAAAAARWLWNALFGPFDPRAAEPDRLLLEAMWEVDAMYPQSPRIAPRLDLRRLVPPDAACAKVRPLPPKPEPRQLRVVKG